MLTCKIALLDSHPQYLLMTITDFEHFLSLDGMNSVFSFNKYKKNVFIFSCWLLPEKLWLCPTQGVGLQRLSPLAHTPMGISVDSYYASIEVRAPSL